MARSVPSHRRRRTRRSRPHQLELPKTSGWGGRRVGSGRKPKVENALPRVPHTTRPEHKGRFPVHVTLRAKTGLPSFRQQLVQAVLAGVLRDQRRRRYRRVFRVLHYSLQSNHLHVVVEADTEAAHDFLPLRSGISGLAIAFARRLNKLLHREGSVWSDRYHRHDLKTPTETRNGFAYLFANYAHHGVKSVAAGALDPFSSACMFDGWAQTRAGPPERDRWRWPVCRAQTWLARIGCLFEGKLALPPLV